MVPSTLETMPFNKFPLLLLPMVSTVAARQLVTFDDGRSYLIWVLLVVDFVEEAVPPCGLGIVTRNGRDGHSG